MNRVMVKRDTNKKRERLEEEQMKAATSLPTFLLKPSFYTDPSKPKKPYRSSSSRKRGSELLVHTKLQKKSK